MTGPRRLLLLLSLLTPAAGCALRPAEAPGGAAEPRNAALRFLPNEPAEYDFGDQRVLPPTFGSAEFTLELWIRPDTAFPVGSTARRTATQLTHWSDADPRPYSSSTWWFSGNWLLDGHTRPRGFSPFDTREGTFSLQLYGGGRVRWTFADDDETVPQGKVWAVQAWPAETAPSLLDGNWHHVTCVRRWVGESAARLELWIDGALIAVTAIPHRTDMRRFWDQLPHPGNPRHLGGWAWGSEVMLAWNYYFTQYEDYKGEIAELRFWDRARPPAEIAASWNRAVTGREPGLVGWYPLDEGSGDIVRDRMAPDRIIQLHRTRAGSWVSERPPLLPPLAAQQGT